MNAFIKKIAIPFLNVALKNKKNVCVSGNSNVNYGLLKSEKVKTTKKYPAIITNSNIGNIGLGEGCRFFDCVCLGKVQLGRFVTLAGPGVKVCGNVDGIEIGSFTSIGANVVIQEGEHDYERLTTYFVNRNVLENGKKEEITKGKITIQEGVWIGSNSVILSGVTIGRGAVIGAGSIVTKDVEPYSICVGAPCKEVKKRFSDDVIQKIENSRWWEMSTDEMKNNVHLFEDREFEKYL